MKRTTVPDVIVTTAGIVIMLTGAYIGLYLFASVIFTRNY